MRTSLLVLSALLISGAAFAGGKAKEVDPYPAIVLTGISEFDGVFGQAKGVQDKLKSEKATLTKARAETAVALGVATDAPFATAFGELQTKAERKIKVLSEGGVPKLNPESAVPDNVQAGIDSVNALIVSANGTVGVATGLKGDAVRLASECGAFPGQVPGLVKNPMEILGRSKLVGDAVKATAALPDRVQALVDEAGKILSDVVAAFGA